MQGGGGAGWHCQILTGAPGVCRPEESRLGSPRCPPAAAAWELWASALPCLGILFLFLPHPLPGPNGGTRGPGDPLSPGPAQPQVASTSRSRRATARRAPAGTIEEFLGHPPAADDFSPGISGLAPFEWDDGVLASLSVPDYPEKPWQGKRGSLQAGSSHSSSSVRLALCRCLASGSVYIASGGRAALPTPARRPALPSRAPGSRTWQTPATSPRKAGAGEWGAGGRVQPRRISAFRSSSQRPRPLPSPAQTSVSPPPSPLREEEIKKYCPLGAYDGPVGSFSCRKRMVTWTAERESVTGGRDEIDGQSAHFSEDRIPRTARGRDVAAPPLPGWTPLTSVASFPPGARGSQPLPAEERVDSARRSRSSWTSSRTRVLPGSRWSPCIPLEPPGKLAPEGVELEFRWVIPRGALEKMFREDEEGDAVPMSKADTFLLDTWRGWASSLS